jgi:hypothetical protein
MPQNSRWFHKANYSQEGGLASMGLAAVAAHKLGGILSVGTLQFEARKVTPS